MLIILILAAVAAIIFGLWLKRRHRRKETERHRDSVLGTRDAMQVLRNPHPIASNSINSQRTIGVGGVVGSGALAPNKEFYGSAGSLPSGSSNTRTHTLRTSMRAPSSSTSDLKGKNKSDDMDVMRPAPARRTSSRRSQRLQRRPNSAEPPSPISPAPKSPR
jgi:hypothetical protein